jgi:hypothetical protein
MRENSQNLNTAVLAQLLTEAFMDQRDLRRFCRDSPEFRPVLELASVSTGLRDHVDVLIRFCETRLLFDELLAAVERDNPRQYARFTPILYDPLPVEHEKPVEAPPADVSESQPWQPVFTTEASSAFIRRTPPRDEESESRAQELMPTSEASDAFTRRTLPQDEELETLTRQPVTPTEVSGESIERRFLRSCHDWWIGNRLRLALSLIGGTAALFLVSGIGGLINEPVEVQIILFSAGCVIGPLTAFWLLRKLPNNLDLSRSLDWWRKNRLRLLLTIVGATIIGLVPIVVYYRAFHGYDPYLGDLYPILHEEALWWAAASLFFALTTFWLWRKLTNILDR